ncbi:conserved membrane hypothetical protein [Alteromonas sp. 38]|nr:conserved membrane hypothetical protein [Alteromonas sp. 154]VXB15314.1 conserved membrane hypothetical protein [Alteromonas sp. 38]
MVGYKWRCMACDSSNESGTSVCGKCGCAAGASVKEIEQHLNPDKVRMDKARNTFDKKLTQLLFLPFCAVIFSLTGRLEILALLAISSLFFFKTQSSFILFIKSEKWLRNVLISCSSLLVILIVSRVLFISDNSIFVGWLVFGYLIVTVFAYFLLFKHQRGKEAFSRYYQANGS